MPANPTHVIRLIVALSIHVKKSIQQTQPAAIRHSTLLRAMEKSGLSIQQHLTLVVNIKGRLIREHIPNFVAKNKSGEVVVVRLILSYQTKPADVDEAQGCLDADCENTTGLLINFGGARFWSSHCLSRTSTNPISVSGVSYEQLIQ